METFGRLLIIIGLAIAFCGLVILIFTRIFPSLDNLPGDFHIEGKNFQIYFPFATMILISLIATIVLNILIRIFRR